MRRADRSFRGVLPSVVPPMSATVRHRKGGTRPGIGPNFHRKQIFSFVSYLVYLLIIQLFMPKSTENFEFISSVM